MTAMATLAASVRIREPEVSPADVERLQRLLDDVRGPSLTLGLLHLSATERRLFDVLYLNRPYFAPGEAVLRAVCGDGYDLHVLRVNVSRLRGKLRAHGWRIECKHIAYRLCAEEQRP